MFKYTNVKIIVLMALKSTPITLALAALTVVGFSGVFKYVAAQDQQNNNNDPTTFLQSAKTHLAQAASDLKNGSGSQSALSAINMTHQDIMSAEKLVNSSLICNNINNLGFCSVAPTS
jgi:hypothetical protein